MNAYLKVRSHPVYPLFYRSRYKSCPFTEKIIGNVINEIDRLGLYLNAEKTNVILPDPKDTVFYEIVMEKRKTEDAYLVTGNIKHFPSEPFIVTPREMMTMIVNDFSD